MYRSLMSKNKVVAMIVLVGVVFLGLGGSYWAYKKIQAKRNQEYRYEGSLPIHDGFDVQEFKRVILSDKILDQVVVNNNLVEFWDMPSAEAAKNRLREKFKTRVDGQNVHVSYQDHDKEKAQAILAGLVEACMARQGSRQNMPPISP